MEPLQFLRDDVPPFVAEAQARIIEFTTRPNFRTADDWITVARGRQDLAKRLEVYNAALTHLQDARLYLERGACRHELRDFSGARSDLDAAVDLDSNLVEALRHRAYLAASQGRHAEAIADLDAALAIEPDHAYALGKRATSKHASGDREGAQIDLERALAIFDRCVPALLLKARILGDAGDYGEAEKQMDVVIAESHRNATFYAIRASYRYSRGDLPGVLADLTQAVNLEPTLPRFRGRRAVILAQLGHRSMAMRDVEVIGSLAPDSSNVPFTAALVAFHLGYNEESRRENQRAIDIDPFHPGAHYNLACSYVRLGRHEDAVNTLLRTFELDRKMKPKARTDADLQPILTDPRVAEALAT